MARPFYVTTPIYYPNDAPHIGHAYTSVAADTLARWRRMWGDDVVFLTGTDEHGTKIERAAEAQGITPQEMVDRTSAQFRELTPLLDLTNTDFIRTTEPRTNGRCSSSSRSSTTPATSSSAPTRASTASRCEAYYTEDELVDGKCPMHGTPRRARHRGELLLQAVGLRAATHRPLRRASGSGAAGDAPQRSARLHPAGSHRLLDEPQVGDVGDPAAVGSRRRRVTCGSTRCSTTAPRSGTAAIPSGSIATGPSTTTSIGKDILRFHAVYWPAMLMAAGLEPPKCVFAHGWLLVGGEKMSKTRLNQIAPADLVADFGVDGFRYHFLRDQHFGPDGDISYEAMVARYNADLANNFGNLANRVLNMAMSYCGGVVPDARDNGPLVDASARAFAGLTEGMEKLDYSNGFGAVWDLIRDTNSYIEDKQPWALNKAGDAAAVAAVLGDCLEALRVVALLSSPLIPRASAELWRRLGLPGNPADERLPDAAEWGLLPAGSTLDKGAPLFPRIET